MRPLTPKQLACLGTLGLGGGAILLAAPADDRRRHRALARRGLCHDPSGGEAWQLTDDGRAYLRANSEAVRAALEAGH